MFNTGRYIHGILIWGIYGGYLYCSMQSEGLLLGCSVLNSVSEMQFNTETSQPKFEHCLSPAFKMIHEHLLYFFRYDDWRLLKIQKIVREIEAKKRIDCFLQDPENAKYISAEDRSTLESYMGKGSIM